MDNLNNRPAPTPPVEASDPQWQQQLASYMQSLDKIRNGHYARLLSYLDATDRQQVAYRTLRAVLAGQEYSEVPLVLPGTPSPLNPERYRPYLLDQIALYVFLFKDKQEQEAQFIEEACGKLRHWADQQLRLQAAPGTPDLDNGPDDIMLEVREDFLKKIRRLRLQGGLDDFYVDARLTTYLWAFVKQAHLVDKWLARHQHHIDADDLPPAHTPTDDPVARYDDADEAIRRKQLVEVVLNTLGKRCQKLIRQQMENPPRVLARFLQRLNGTNSRLRECWETFTQQVKALASNSSVYLRPQ